MAHQITATDGLMLAGQPAWHGLGNVLPARCSPFEALEAANMNWSVEVCPFNAVLKDGTSVPSGEYRAVVRSDTQEVFATCSEGYSPIQNLDLATMANNISDASGRAVESAGSIRGGRRVWFLLDMGTIYAASDDKIKPYLFIGTSHDLSMSLTVGAISTRVVCANTYAIALKESKDNGMKIRHTASANDRIARIKEWLAEPQAVIKDYADNAVRMAEAGITDEQLQAYFFSVWQRCNGTLTDQDIKEETRRSTRFKTEVSKWLSNFRTDDRQIGLSTKGTVWAALNSITQYANHERTVRSEETDRTRRQESVLFGSAARLNDAAYEAAVALVS